MGLIECLRNSLDWGPVHLSKRYIKWGFGFRLCNLFAQWAVEKLNCTKLSLIWEWDSCVSHSTELLTYSLKLNRCIASSHWVLCHASPRSFVVFLGLGYRQFSRAIVDVYSLWSLDQLTASHPNGRRKWMTKSPAKKTNFRSNHKRHRIRFYNRLWLTWQKSSAMTIIRLFLAIVYDVIER